MGESLHPWGMNGRRYASDRGEPTGRSATPSHRTHRLAYHPTNDTRPAPRAGRSIAAPRRAVCLVIGYASRRCGKRCRWEACRPRPQRPARHFQSQHQDGPRVVFKRMPHRLRTTLPARTSPDHIDHQLAGWRKLPWPAAKIVEAAHPRSTARSISPKSKSPPHHHTDAVLGRRSQRCRPLTRTWSLTTTHHDRTRLSIPP